MKKRLLAILLGVTMAFSMGACGNADDGNTQGASGTLENLEQPTIEKLADYSDMSVVLSGDYEITDAVLKVYFSNVLFDAGVGVMPVTDRDTVQAGDIVKTDYTGYLNGEAFAGGSTINNGVSNPQWIDVSNNCGIDASTGSATSSFIPGFTDGLIGAKVGEPKSGDVTFPENYSNTDLAGQPTTFEFVVHEIYTVITPENITDEFVAEHLAEKYEVNTVAEFWDFLEKEMAYNYTINYLIENSTFNIPEEYLYARLGDYQAYFEAMYCPDTGLESYLAMYGYTVDQMQAQWLTSIKNQIHAELVFAAVSENEKLAIDDAEHESFIQEIISINGGFFPDADSVYKYAGAGNAEAGQAYMKNQNAVRDYFIANYDK